VTVSSSNRTESAAAGPLRAYAAPAAIGALAALTELGGEPLRQLFRYDRAAVAGGELWRLLTGHLEHLGPSHMVMNVIALSVLAFVLGPLLKPRDWIAVSLSSALAIDAGLYWLNPSIAWYVGLSGVLHGYWAAASVNGLIRRRPEALALTALILVKLGYETFVGSVPLTGEIAAGPVVTEAHAFGAAGGALWPLAVLAIRRLRRSL